MELITNESIRAALMSKRKKESFEKDQYVSSGSTTFNLGCTGRTDCAFKKGHYYHLVGDSSAGKTFFSLTCLAEAALNPAFEDYDLIHIDAEHGSLFKTQQFWPVLVDRVQVEECDTIDEFWDMLVKRLRAGKPCIVILDSEDMLKASADIKKYDKQAKMREKIRKGGKGEDMAGSFGTNKARENSGMFPLVISLLKKTGSILIIISQTRDKIGQTFMSFGPEKTYSGGHALKFYATLQIWLSVKMAIKKRVKGKDRKLGNTIRIDIKKNRQIGGDRRMHANFYYRTGIDDIGTCIDYLVEEGYWKENGGKVNAKDFGFKGNREDVAQHVQENGLEKKLRLLVKRLWGEIEAACTINRKNKYEV
jgi:RecA/RadA recombinase